MIYQDLVPDRSSTEKERIIISAFHLYSCEDGDGSGKNRVTTLVYKIRYTPKVYTR